MLSAQGFQHAGFKKVVLEKNRDTDHFEFSLEDVGKQHRGTHGKPVPLRSDRVRQLLQRILAVQRLARLPACASVLGAQRRAAP